MSDVTTYKLFINLQRYKEKEKRRVVSFNAFKKSMYKNSKLTGTLAGSGPLLVEGVGVGYKDGRGTT